MDHGHWQSGGRRLGSGARVPRGRARRAARRRGRAARARRLDGEPPARPARERARHLPVRPHARRYGRYRAQLINEIKTGTSGGGVPTEIPRLETLCRSSWITFATENVGSEDRAAKLGRTIET